MCGIAGIISRDWLTAAELVELNSVNRGLIHRGPDGEGIFSDNPHLALAMRRLSIIDLEHGFQPLFNEDRSLALVANGEIYNFVELRRSLEAAGHHFQTGSDCETILHLYEQHGLDFVQHLRGMFAFALWDSRNRRLIVARDRMGEKPLYLYEEDGRLMFASEMKSLLRFSSVPFELDPESINLYFHYQYVPEPRTPLKGVRKLDAAHMLVIDLEPWRVREHCYWRMEDAPPIESGNPAELIREELETVSELVIRSDVPVGVALSGGLDSSAIAALAVKKYPGTMHAFSVGYTGRPENDERADAKRLADHLGMPFHDVELTTEDVVSSFGELNYWRDDPIADIAGLGYLAVMKLAREHNVPVVLQGQGGDELFWGYEWVRQAALQTGKKGALQRDGWRALASYINLNLPSEMTRPAISQWIRSTAGLRPSIYQLRNHRSSPANQWVFYDLVADFRHAAKDQPKLFTNSFNEQVAGSSAADLFTFQQPWPDPSIWITKLICDTFLRENGITQGDRLSMASSIELRLPLVDYRLVETVVGLRKVQDDMRQGPKAWFRASLQGLLPDWVMNRRKRGFSPPTLKWHQELFKSYGSSLDGGYLVSNGVLNSNSARLLSSGPIPDHAITPLSFKALVLEHWCRQMGAGREVRSARGQGMGVGG
jgi:asparagine synthase (glutamine-hydrolysing)